MPRLLHCFYQPSLVLGAIAADARRNQLAPLLDKLFQPLNIFIIYRFGLVRAKTADFIIIKSTRLCHSHPMRRLRPHFKMSQMQSRLNSA